MLNRFIIPLAIIALLATQTVFGAVTGKPTLKTSPTGQKPGQSLAEKNPSINVLSIIPAHGEPGTSVTLYGTGFTDPTKHINGVMVVNSNFLQAHRAAVVGIVRAGAAAMASSSGLRFGRMAGPGTRLLPLARPGSFDSAAGASIDQKASSSSGISEPTADIAVGPRSGAAPDYICARRQFPGHSRIARVSPGPATTPPDAWIVPLPLLHRHRGGGDRGLLTPPWYRAETELLQPGEGRDRQRAAATANAYAELPDKFNHQSRMT